MDYPNLRKCPDTRMASLLQLAVPVLAFTVSPDQSVSPATRSKAATVSPTSRKRSNVGSLPSPTHSGVTLLYISSTREVYLGFGGTTVVTFKGLGTFNESARSLRDVLKHISGSPHEKELRCSTILNPEELSRLTWWSASQPRWLTDFLPLVGVTPLRWPQDEKRQKMEKEEYMMYLLRLLEEEQKFNVQHQKMKVSAARAALAGIPQSETLNTSSTKGSTK